MRESKQPTPQIRLERDLDLFSWYVIGEVARASKRADLLAVLLMADERGEVSAPQVAEHLLGEGQSRRVVAERLLRIAESYDLLQDTGDGERTSARHGERKPPRFRLTEPGRAAISDGQVYVPEHGTWAVLAANDPLLPSPNLEVTPWKEPTSFQEVFGDGKELAKQRRFEPLPDWMFGAGTADVLRPAPDGSSRQIGVVELKGESLHVGWCDRLVWDVSTGRLRLEDGRPGSAFIALPAPTHTHDDVWRSLLEGANLWSTWDQEYEALRVGFDGTTASERESLRRDVVFEHPSIPDLGDFDATTVEGVALRARSAQDAARWADWRLRARVRDYATAERFSAWAADAVAPFSEFSPPVPTRKALADAAWAARTDRPTPSAWHLVAAEDWSL